MNQIDVSFCLPLYNVQDYVKECILSIINQKISYDYEIIIVDDCSTDNSANICVELQKKYNFIRIIKNEKNSGLPFTRNVAIKNALGKYIWFVDPDDLLYKNSAQKLIDIIYEKDCDIIFANYITFNQNETIKYLPIKKDITVTRTSDYAPCSQTGHKTSSVWAGLFKKEFLIKNNLFFNEKMYAQEDTLFFYEFSLKTTNIYKCDLNCYCYRTRSTSIMHSRTLERSKKYYLAMFEMYNVYCNYFKQDEYKNSQQLMIKIHHSQQNIAQCLAMINDDKYVKKAKRIKDLSL